MKRYKLVNANIFENEHCLFIQRDDNSLTEISGEDLSLIKKCIHFLKKEENIREGEFDVEIINWLLQNNIIIEHKDQEQELAVAFLGDFDENELQDVCARLSSNYLKVQKIYFNNSFHIDESCLEEVQLVILFGDLLTNKEEVYSLNKLLYINNIPIVYFNTYASSFDLGPLFLKKQDTPCLESFVKRKIANLKNPNEYYETLGKMLTNTKSLNKKRHSLKGKIGDMALSALSLELEFFEKHQLSRLYGNTFTYDFDSHEIEKSRLIKVQNLSYENFAPLNPFD